MSFFNGNRFQSWFRFLAIVGIFSIYYLYYLTDFKDGEVDSVPAYIGVAKLAAFGIFMFWLMPFRVVARYKDDVLLVYFFSLCAVTNKIIIIPMNYITVIIINYFIFRIH